MIVKKSPEMPDHTYIKGPNQLNVFMNIQLHAENKLHTPAHLWYIVSFSFCNIFGMPKNAWSHPFESFEYICNFYGFLNAVTKSTSCFNWLQRLSWLTILIVLSIFWLVWPHPPEVEVNLLILWIFNHMQKKLYMTRWTNGRTNK